MVETKHFRLGDEDATEFYKEFEKHYEIWKKGNSPIVHLSGDELVCLIRDIRSMSGYAHYFLHLNGASARIDIIYQDRNGKEPFRGKTDRVSYLEGWIVGEEEPVETLREKLTQIGKVNIQFE